MHCALAHMGLCYNGPDAYVSLRVIRARNKVCVPQSSGRLVRFPKLLERGIEGGPHNFLPVSDSSLITRDS